LGQDLANLAAANAVPNSAGDQKNRRDLDLFSKSLAHPPYPMLAIEHYEDKQWVILLDQTRILDVWYGEGQFSAWIYKRVAKP